MILNKNLIDGYSKQCQGEWFRYLQDDYFYQYLIYHTIEAEDYNTIQKIMKDFNWMNNKLQSDKTIYNLCVDMKKAIDYLQTKEIEVCCIRKRIIASSIWLFKLVLICRLINFVVQFIS